MKFKVTLYDVYRPKVNLQCSGFIRKDIVCKSIVIGELVNDKEKFYYCVNHWKLYIDPTFKFSGSVRGKRDKAKKLLKQNE